MDKGSADRLESPTSEASSPTFRRRQRADRARGLPARMKSLAAKDVRCQETVEITTNLLSSDVGFLEAPEQGSTEAAKDITENTFHPETSYGRGADRRYKPKSGFTSKGSRHLHRHRSKERESVKAAESTEPPIAAGVTSSGSTRIEGNDAFLRSEAKGTIRPQVSDTSQTKAAKPSQECASPHAAPSAHVTCPQTPERSSALANRSRNLPKKPSTSTSSLKKRERPTKSVSVPVSPRPTALTHTLSQSEDGSLAVLDVYATSAYDNAVSPSTASEGEWYPHTLGQMSPTSDIVSLALAPIKESSRFVVRSPADSSPESVFAPNAAQKQQSPASPGLTDGCAPLRSSDKASPTPPVTALPQRVAFPRESCVSSTLITKSSSSFSMTPSGHKQPADAPISKGLGGSSATGVSSPQPLLGEIALSVVGSKVESTTANV